MTEGTINIFDILGAIVLITMIIVVANFYKNSKLEEKPEYKYFTWGLITKIVGAVALAFVYVFYYGGGDTLYYFGGGKTLANTLFHDIQSYFRLLFSESKYFSTDLEHITHLIVFSRSPEEWFMVKITSFINLFSFNRYLISSVFISLIAFYGSWKMFKSFIYFFPKYHKAIFISVFMLPSVIFWSSGILKDTITFAALGIFFYHFVNIFFRRRFSLLSIIIIFITVYIIFKLKAYIILGFMPAIFIALYIKFKNIISNNLLRKLFAPVILLLMLFIGYFSILNLVNQSKKYEIDTIESRVEGFHTWHTTQGGSSYNLGNVEYTPIGIIKKIPEALNVTFFRPYIWEVKSPTSLLGSFESLAIFILFILIMWKYKLKWIIKSFNNSFLALAFIYSIIFGFAVGFTSYNFGALARYKVPVMPFFVFLLLYFYYKDKMETSTKSSN